MACHLYFRYYFTYRMMLGKDPEKAQHMKRARDARKQRRTAERPRKLVVLRALGAPPLPAGRRGGFDVLRWASTHDLVLEGVAAFTTECPASALAAQVRYRSRERTGGARRARTGGVRRARVDISPRHHFESLKLNVSCTIYDALAAQGPALAAQQRALWASAATPAKTSRADAAKAKAKADAAAKTHFPVFASLWGSAFGNGSTTNGAMTDNGATTNCAASPAAGDAAPDAVAAEEAAAPVDDKALRLLEQRLVALRARFGLAADGKPADSSADLLKCNFGGGNDSARMIVENGDAMVSGGAPEFEDDADEEALKVRGARVTDGRRDGGVRPAAALARHRRAAVGGGGETAPPSRGR